MESKDESLFSYTQHGTELLMDTLNIGKFLEGTSCQISDVIYDLTDGLYNIFILNIYIILKEMEKTFHEIHSLMKKNLKIL